MQIAQYCRSKQELRVVRKPGVSVARRRYIRRLGETRWLCKPGHTYFNPPTLAHAATLGGLSSVHHVSNSFKAKPQTQRQTLKRVRREGRTTTTTTTTTNEVAWSRQSSNPTQEVPQAEAIYKEWVFSCPMMHSRALRLGCTRIPSELPLPSGCRSGPTALDQPWTGTRCTRSVMLGRHDGLECRIKPHVENARLKRMAVPPAPRAPAVTSAKMGGSSGQQ